MTQRRKWNKKLLLLEIKKRSIQLKRKPSKRECSSIYATTRKYFGTWNNALKEAGFEVKKLQKPIIPNKLTPELSYFLGLLVTDGHIAKDKLIGYKILLFTSYPEEKILILKLIRYLFDYNASIRIKKYGFNKNPNYEIYISSRKLAGYISKKFQIPIGAKSSIIRVPQILFNTTHQNISSFIRGVIDGDGTISSESKCVRIASGSINFLNDIKRLLSIIEISSGNIIKDKSRNTWILYISTTENLRRLRNQLYNGVNLFYPRKMASWKDI